MCNGGSRNRWNSNYCGFVLRDGNSILFFIANFVSRSVRFSLRIPKLVRIPKLSKISKFDRKFVETLDCHTIDRHLSIYLSRGITKNIWTYFFAKLIFFPPKRFFLYFGKGKSFWAKKNIFFFFFIAILQWSIGHPSSASIDGGFWLELVVRQMMFSRIPPKQCASRWLWGVHVIFFLAGSILIRCGKFRFDFFVGCVLSNHIFFALSLHLFLTVQFFPTALGW